MMSRAIIRLKGLLAVAMLAYYTPVSAALQANDKLVINATVMTEKGAAILDLNRENFSVSLDNRPQNLVAVNGGVPASIGILIDTSESQIYGPKTVVGFNQILTAGLERFLQLGHPANEYFLMTFNNDITAVQDWTSEHGSITDKLYSLQYKGQTSLYDAISKAVAKVMAGRNGKHILIVFSDGMDSYSRATFKDVREALMRSDVVLYAFGNMKVSSDQTELMAAEGAAILDEYAKLTGGRSSYWKNRLQSGVLTKALESTVLELRSQYQLIINPEAAAGKEKWRKLKVTAARNDLSGKPLKLIVKTREGYYR